MLKRVEKAIYIVLSLIFFWILFYYSIFFDVILILILLWSSFSIGLLFNIKEKYISKIFIQLSIGLGIIGIIIYFILLFGLGSTTMYTLILGVPLVYNFKKSVNIFKHIINKCSVIILKNNESKIFMVFFLIIFNVYLILGSVPISTYDALTKHLPLTMYAARNGEWYINIIESVVYGESMLLHYTYSVLFATFGAFKALILFNVILYFLIFLVLVQFCRILYKETNIWLLSGIYFTVPMFVQRTIMMSLEITSFLFLFVGILTIVSLKKKSIWDNIPITAFLFGCSFFVKITNSYTILVIGILAIIYLLAHYFSEIKQFKKLLCKVFICILLFFGPYTISLITMWYRVGSPMFPFFNEIFKSPYYTQINTIDPYNNSPLSLNISSLFKMIFETSKNIEMSNGAIGIFLLLFFLIPHAVLLYRKKEYTIWGGVPFIIFPISCLFTYNLRYFITIFIIFLCLIVIAISIIIDKSFKKFYNAVYLIMAIVLIIPNINYIRQHMNVRQKVVKDSSIEKSDIKFILNEIPSNKKVFSIGDTFKGTYEGFFSTYTHYSIYTLFKLDSNEVSWEEYLKSFDYIVYRKNYQYDNYQIHKIINEVDESNSFLSTFAETKTHIAYKVISKNIKRSIILSKDFKEPVISKTSQPIIERFDNNDNSYILTHVIENTTKANIDMRFQINWYDKNGQFLSTDINIYCAKPGKNIYSSNIINTYKDADYGIVFITTHNDENIMVYNYKLESYEEYNYNKIETDKLYNRELLPDWLN